MAGPAVSAVWRLRFALLFLGLCLALLLAFNFSRPRILVLHSSSQTRSASQRMDQGMREALQANRQPLRINHLYLALDEPDRQARQRQGLADVQRAMRRLRPDLVITIDDEANALVGRDLAAEPGQRLLYVSIDQPPEFYGYDRHPDRVTGVVERLPLQALHQLLAQLGTGQARRVAVLGADTPTGRAHAAQVQGFDWAPHRLGPVQLVRTQAAWQAHVQGPAADADVLLLLNLPVLPARDPDGPVQPAAALVSWTETQARAMPLGLQEAWVRQGGGLGIAPNRADQGRRAMQQALRQLDGRFSEPLRAPVVARHFDLVLRPAALARRGTQLPEVYTEAARAAGTLYP